MLKSIIWETPSVTSLGDRLLDTMLMSAYAKILNSNLYFKWPECEFTIGQKNPKYNYRIGEERSWDSVRLNDYKLENFTEYFTLPKNLKINQACDPDNKFSYGLGGCVSPVLFWENHLKTICSYEKFMESFKSVINEFKPTEKLKNIIKNITPPKVSIHLRRTDKININGDYTTFMTYEGLDDLDIRTKEAINIFYNESDVFYFSSDDNLVRKEYEKLYVNHLPHNFECTDIEKTYVDLYLLSISENIILSQVHSNFSIFASLLNGAKVIYLYDKCSIVNERFNELGNFIHYKQITI